MGSFDKPTLEGLYHYGTPRHSGRYRWGSGENPQRNKSFLGQYDELRKQGLTEKEIATYMHLSTGEFRARRSAAMDKERLNRYNFATKLLNEGKTKVEIGRIMGTNESSIRSLLNQESLKRTKKGSEIGEVLKETVKKNKYVDVGIGVEKQLNISENKLQSVLNDLEKNGYTVHKLYIDQATNKGQKTTIKVLTKDDVEWKDVYKNRDKIKSPNDNFDTSDGITNQNMKPPVSIDKKRVSIRYAEDGGITRDGLIEIRPGVADVSLGANKYVQVRIAVDDTHYLKGMATYAIEPLPDGVDIVFNTNKHKGTPMINKEDKDNSVLKPMKKTATGEIDPDNPFGSTIKAQRDYIDSKGEKKQSSINIVNENEDWDNWSRNLPAQMLGKQLPALAKQQLDLTYKEKKQEFEEYAALTQPSVKRKLLETFAEQCDSEAVHLKAAALPGQKTHVILPVDSLSEKQVYAPNYQNGEEVVLVRFPHAGTFEMPRLIVNNKNKEAMARIGTDAKTAIGINSKVAEQLSGADFDGDTVIVIPTKGQNIKTSPARKELISFDPKEQYKAYEGMPRVGPKQGFNKQREMGGVSNLITDMTIKGAPIEDIVKAVKHSMVIIDAEKHNLDWKRSAKDNDIASLKTKYQGGPRAGASTLISQATSEYRVPERAIGYKTDPVTGEKIYRETGKMVRGKSGKKDADGKPIYVDKPAQTMSTRMAETKDAHTLSSGTRIEAIYADHANRLKALANQARKEALATKDPARTPKASQEYATEVASLTSNLNIALMNAPKERKAQLVASKVIELKKQANKDMEKEEIKKISDRALAAARIRAGANKKDVMVNISEKEWKAIEAGAISKTKLEQILDNTDLDKVRQYATPKNSKSVNTAKINRAKALLAAGYTQADVADAVGLSTSEVNKLANI